MRASVKAYNGNGYLFAQQALYERLAPTFRQIMVNSSDSPIMRLFENFQNPPPLRPAAPNSPATATTATPGGKP
jgi:hypothetical protein